jgi:hypothetical protein
MHTGYGGFPTKTPSLIWLTSKHLLVKKLKIKFSSVLRMKDMRLMGLGDFAWDKGFPGLGINTNLICLHIIGTYPKAILTLSNTTSFPNSSSKPWCSMMGIIPSMPGDLYIYSIMTLLETAQCSLETFYFQNSSSRLSQPPEGSVIIFQPGKCTQSNYSSLVLCCSVFSIIQMDRTNCTLHIL